MEVYLVRHGQTDGNVGRRHQHPDTTLNEFGRGQAATVAKILADLKPTHLITSSQVRALETARVIASVTDLIPESSPLFRELKQAASMEGERLTGLRAFWHAAYWFLGVNSSSMHDGETYEMFLTRLTRAREYLEALPPHARVVVVSHSVFISFFLEHMRHTKRMNLIRAGVRGVHILRLKNTSITHVHYEKPHRGYVGTGWHSVWGK